MQTKSIVFFGSGPVAAKSLALLAQNFTIEAVVTKPATVVQMSSIVSGDRVYSAGNKLELDDLIVAKQFSSQLAILIDFGIIVSEKVIQSFEYGIINSHFSILPELRGADPISFAILSGQAKTGVSLMLVDKGMDTGKIITSKVLKIDPGDTTPSLTEKLITLSNGLLTDFVPKYIDGTIKPKTQPHPDRATYSRKLSKKDGLIDWSKPAEAIEREIRAFIDWPKSRTNLAGKDVIITKAHAAPSNSPGSKPGGVEQSLLEQGILMIETAKGTLCVDELKPAGKKEMPVQAFLAGYKHLLKKD